MPDQMRRVLLRLGPGLRRAIDPEGDYLEFERFNAHEENVDVMPPLDALEPLYSDRGSRPGDLGVRTTVLWL